MLKESSPEAEVEVLSKKSNKKATAMAKKFFNSGMSFDAFLKKEGYIQKNKK